MTENRIGAKIQNNQVRPNAKVWRESSNSLTLEYQIQFIFLHDLLSSKLNIEKFSSPKFLKNDFEI